MSATAPAPGPHAAREEGGGAPADRRRRAALGVVADLVPDLLDVVGQAVIVLAPDGEVLFLNRAAEELYRWPAEDAIGRDAGEVLVRADHRDEADTAMAALRRDGGWSGEFEVRRRDGSEVPVHVTTSVRRDDAGEVVAMVGVSVDISERRAAERALRASERRLASMLEQSSDAIALIGADGAVQYVSPALPRILGYAEGLPEGLFDLVDPVDLPALRSTIAAAVATGTEQPVEFRCRAAGGGWRAFEGAVRDLRDQPGARGAVVTAHDVTDRRRAEGARRSADERLRVVLAHVPVALFAVDRAAVFRMAEGEAASASGVDMASLVGEDARRRFGDQPELLEAIDRALAGHPASARSEVGGRLWHTDLRPVLEADGEVTGAIGVSHDVTERVEAERELTRMAMHDPLTGLPNRALALDRLHQAINRRGRRDVAVLFIDVDELKRVNDGLGHATGDALLRVHADRLRAMVRSGDTVARYAGDEFLVIAQDLASPQEAVELGERLLAGIAVPVLLGGVELVPSVSIGIAVAPLEPPGSAVADDVLREADAAMYQAKRDGRGRVRMFDPALRIDVLARLRTEGELRVGLAGQRFRVHYQPIHDLGSGDVVGAEALVRWDHPERGLLLPAEFLTVAEGAGLLAELGDVVLEDACRRARAWADDGHRLRVAVNLCVQQLRDPGFDGHVRATLDRAGLDPADLVVEVGEPAVAAGGESAVGTLQRLRQLGVGVSLDDFGTGSSSLTHLRTLPVDQLKVDRTFVAGVADARGGVAIVTAVIDLAHALGLRVVAEGIERPDQLEALTRMGCELGQGYLLGRPVPADVLGAQLAEGPGGPGSATGTRR